MRPPVYSNRLLQQPRSILTLASIQTSQKIRGFFRKPAHRRTSASDLVQCTTPELSDFSRNRTNQKVFQIPKFSRGRIKDQTGQKGGQGGTPGGDTGGRVRPEKACFAFVVWGSRSGGGLRWCLNGSSGSAGPSMRTVELLAQHFSRRPAFELALGLKNFTRTETCCASFCASFASEN